MKYVGVVVYFFVFNCLFVTEVLAADEVLNLVQNTAKVVEHSSNESVRDKAHELREQAKQCDDKEKCPDSNTDLPTNNSKSPLTSRSPVDNTEASPERVKMFFELQFLASGKNGKPMFHTMSIPYLSVKDALPKSQKSRSNILGEGTSKIRLALESYSNLSGPAEKDAVDNAILLYDLSKLGSEEEIYAMIKKRLGGASFQRKVSFIANFLSYANDNYNDNLAGGNQDNSNVATTLTIFSAIHESIETGKEVPSGVCRHMHQSALKLARAMGINEAFGVGFNTAGSGHRTVILSDPSDPAKVVQLSYGSRSDHEGMGGPQVLSQNGRSPDADIRFRIYSADDRAVIILPSELGGVLNRVTGGEDSDLSPNYRSEAQIQQYGVKTPYGTVRFFRASTPLGNQSKIQGTSYNVRLDYNDVFYGEFGIAGFSSQRETEAGELNMVGAYGRVTQGVNWKFYESDNLSLSTFGELHLKGTLSCSTLADGDCSLRAGFDASMQAGVSLDYQTDGLMHRTSFLAQAQHDQRRVTNSSPKVGIFVPVYKLSQETSFHLDSDLVGNVGGSLTVYNLGTGVYSTYEGHAGVDITSSGTSIGLSSEGRLSNATPFWLPQSERQGRFRFRQNLLDEGQLYIGAEGSKSIDVKDNHYFGLTFGGNL